MGSARESWFWVALYCAQEAACFVGRGLFAVLMVLLWTFALLCFFVGFGTIAQAFLR